jgi:hypothetical protein
MIPPILEQRSIVAEQMNSVRARLPRFEAKIQSVLDRV